jgi:hypothetical protein
MRRDAGPVSEVHVHVNRLVIDAGAVPAAGVRDLRDGLADRIGARLADRRTGDSGRPPHVGDVIAEAIAAKVAPLLGGEPEPIGGRWDTQ